MKFSRRPTAFKWANLKSRETQAGIGLTAALFEAAGFMRCTHAQFVSHARTHGHRRSESLAMFRACEVRDHVSPPWTLKDSLQAPAGAPPQPTAHRPQATGRSGFAHSHSHCHTLCPMNNVHWSLARARR